MTCLGFGAPVCRSLSINSLPAIWQRFWYNLLINAAKSDPDSGEIYAKNKKSPTENDLAWGYLIQLLIQKHIFG